MKVFTLVAIVTETKVNVIDLIWISDSFFWAQTIPLWRENEKLEKKKKFAAKKEKRRKNLQLLPYTNSLYKLHNKHASILTPFKDLST